MAQIIAVFFRGSSRLDKLIRWESRGVYSHVAFIIDDVLYEAQAPYGVRLIKDKSQIKTYLSECPVDYFSIEVTDDQKAKCKAFADKQLGKKYAYKLVLYFLYKATVDSRKASGKWFCSEYFFETLNQGGIPLLARVSSWLVNPTVASYSEKLIPTTFQIQP